MHKEKFPFHLTKVFTFNINWFCKADLYWDEKLFRSTVVDHKGWNIEQKLTCSTTTLNKTSQSNTSKHIEQYLTFYLIFSINLLNIFAVLLKQSRKNIQKLIQEHTGIKLEVLLEAEVGLWIRPVHVRTVIRNWN